ncbi:MAG: hypothetical protein OXC02_09435, partial [Rhodobacteraceae bacterium]|nr:hypothetical protein [Paracoccaceae bacterium]
WFSENPLSLRRLVDVSESKATCVIDYLSFNLILKYKIVNVKLSFAQLKHIWLSFETTVSPQASKL